MKSRAGQSNSGANLRDQRKRESRSRILSAAAGLFRKHGFAATGVDAVMNEAGLTAGTFYAHFESKDALLGACMEELFSQGTQGWQTLLQGLSGTPAEKRQKILERYLSTTHRDHPEAGCPLAGIAAELGRNARQTAEPTAQYVEKIVAQLGELGVARERALAEVAKVVGALLLSRLVPGRALSDEILKAARGR